jgi:FKBP-type peptidyl-prolyl cis-trans isomerase
MMRSLFSAIVVAYLVQETAGFGVERSLSRRDAFSPLVFAPFVGTLFPTIANSIDGTDFTDGSRGLKYQIITPGTGVKPVRGQKIKTEYTLYLVGFPENGGKKIDSTKDIFGTQRPFEFMVGVSMVVKGWDLGLMDMSEGESRRLIIPSDLGYGEEGAGGALTGGIPGDATLYFEVTLTELGQLPTMSTDQVKWLDEHPL